MACKRSQVVRDGINDMFLNENVSVIQEVSYSGISLRKF